MQQIKRDGRSGMEIVDEVLDMLLTLSQELTKVTWPYIVNSAVVSIEVQQTLSGLASLWKGKTTAAKGHGGGLVCPNASLLDG